MAERLADSSSDVDEPVEMSDCDELESGDDHNERDQISCMEHSNTRLSTPRIGKGSGHFFLLFFIILITSDATFALRS